MKKLLIYMTIFSLIYFFAGCDSKSIKKTYTTNYGDTFIVTAELHTGMHNDSIDYHILFFYSSFDGFASRSAARFGYIL